MTAIAARPLPDTARWLDDVEMPDKPLRLALVRRALADIGIEESGPNRSGYIDEVTREAGSPLGSSWCACIVRRWARDAGAWFPSQEAGAVRVWVAEAKKLGTWKGADATPYPGDIVCYDMAPDGIADHIGIVARVHTRGPRTVEGNTSYAGASREGIVVAMKPISAARVLGYITPTPRTL